jgi:hypothetical protein
MPVHLMPAAARLRPRRITVERPPLRSRRFYSQGAAREFLAVHCSHSDCGIVLILHFDEAKPAGAPVKAVTHDLSPLYGPDLGERLAQIGVAQRKTQIANK